MPIGGGVVLNAQPASESEATITSATIAPTFLPVYFAYRASALKRIISTLFISLLKSSV
jgi:hypothetical protein